MGKGIVSLKIFWHSSEKSECIELIFLDLFWILILEADYWIAKEPKIWKIISSRFFSFPAIHLSKVSKRKNSEKGFIFFWLFEIVGPDFCDELFIKFYLLTNYVKAFVFVLIDVFNSNTILKTGNTWSQNTFKNPLLNYLNCIGSILSCKIFQNAHLNPHIT